MPERAEQLVDHAAVEAILERTGERYDYSRKRGVLGAEIMLPDGASAWMQDRSALWNAVAFYLFGYRPITAQQARAYKPSRKLFDYAFDTLGVTKDDVVHLCASPHLDHAAAREMGFRCVWIDRGTGRSLLPDYTPDAILATLDQAPALFDTAGW